MPVIRSCFWLFLLCGLITACAVEPQRNRYQIAGQTEAVEAPLTELQQQARNALALGDFQLAIDTLQRAIRIEPRDPWNWHFLGEAYWRQGDLQRCRSMVERAFSYAEQDEYLLRKNRKLEQKCAHG